jgi:hypothetical protein
MLFRLLEAKLEKVEKIIKETEHEKLIFRYVFDKSFFNYDSTMRKGA